LPDIERGDLVSSELYFHIGVLVEDLDEAIARFSKVLGLTFNEPITATFERIEDPRPRESFLRCTYSREGPPHIELLEANGDEGLWSIKNGEGFHHLGFWEADTAGRCAFLEAESVKIGARVVQPSNGRVMTVFNDPSELFGMRVEWLNDVSREAMDVWAKTGKFPGDANV
jgi:catechol 2,3-dioxygenase-like lactoylglutathione lyase family enzyme